MRHGRLELRKTPPALQGSFEIVSDSLDISQQLLSSYGAQMPVEQHMALRQALLPLLDETRGGSVSAR